ncbi:MAG: hypothetical protein EXS23_01340 [Pedosphaera sp.]|nr:hypothetical protein [Pedosphaera sp.]
MIQLHPDCLIFHTSSGDCFPCSAETVTIEIIGDSANKLDPDVLRQAASAVTYYFRHDLGREHVTLDEFTQALSRTLRQLGYDVLTPEATSKSAASPASSADLAMLAFCSPSGFELDFFPRLRTELRSRLAGSSEILLFQGLRRCVKQLTGRQRWCPCCEQKSDQIVRFLRDCLAFEEHEKNCGLVIL